MKFNMMNGGARWNKPKPVQPETRMPRAAANDGRQAPIRKDRRNLPSANNSLIDCFYRIISVNLRVNLRIGVRKGYPSAGLGIFLDKRAGFAGGARRGTGWGNTGGGNLAVGFVPRADVARIIISSSTRCGSVNNTKLAVCESALNFLVH